jgi:hypothetical protein
MDSIINLSFQTEGVDESSVISRMSSVMVYPNPTSGVSSFRFQVSGLEHVTLKIYDLHGREVETVVDGLMPAGEHVVSFDASSLATGVYIYRELSVAKSASGGSSVFSRQTSAGKLIKY